MENFLAWLEFGWRFGSSQNEQQWRGQSEESQSNALHRHTSLSTTSLQTALPPPVFDNIPLHPTIPARDDDSDNEENDDIEDNNNDNNSLPINPLIEHVRSLGSTLTPLLFIEALAAVAEKPKRHGTRRPEQEPLPQNPEMEAVRALNRKEKELRRNSATFRINKWFLYKQVMKAKSTWTGMHQNGCRTISPPGIWCTRTWFL